MKLLLIFIIALNLHSQEISYWDKAKNFGSDMIDSTSTYINDSWKDTKDYTHSTKNIAISKTMINGINAMTDNSKIKVEQFNIDDKTGYIDATIYLNGEDKNLKANVKDFTWSVSENKEYILINNIDATVDIPWIHYLLANMIIRNDGYLILPFQASTFTLLYAIKDNIPLKKDISSIAKFDFVHYAYNKEYFNINKFEVKNNNIIIDISAKGSTENIKFDIKSYVLRTANKKEIIALRDIKFNSCNKPWMKSVITSQDSEVLLDFNPKLYKLFGGIN